MIAQIGSKLLRKGSVAAKVYIRIFKHARQDDFFPMDYLCLSNLQTLLEISSENLCYLCR